MFSLVISSVQDVSLSLAVQNQNGSAENWLENKSKSSKSINVAAVVIGGKHAFNESKSWILLMNSISLQTVMEVTIKAFIFRVTVLSSKSYNCAYVM